MNTTRRLYPPPRSFEGLAQWRASADAFPRVAQLAQALGGEQHRGLARMMESAMQNRAYGHLRVTAREGWTSKAFRVLFPSLPARPSGKSIRLAILDAERKARV